MPCAKQFVLAARLRSQWPTGRTLEVPHPEFAMISIFEAFDVVLITGVEKEGELPSRK